MTAEPSRTTFESLGLSADVLRVLDALGYEEPTPIQRAAIPLLMTGRDVLGSAATGTGKTAAFALPLVERLDPKGRDVQALILAPTRELAMQVSEAVHRYGSHRHSSVLPIYGGQPIHRQLTMLKRGVHVVVGTPGRVLDHIRRGSLNLAGVRYVVLDEADEMLNMGFIEDIEAILSETPADRQTALFSATFPARIKELVKRHLRDPQQVTIQSEVRKTPRVRQVAYTVARPHKLEALGRILDLESPQTAIIFCRTRTEVDELTQAMASHGYSPEALHGGFMQAQRDRVMKRFREGSADLLIATDVAARGLDIEHVSHVINYDIPESPEVYVHRIGRTGRAGREGTAITLVQPREHRLLKAIEKTVKQRIEPARIPTIADVKARRLATLTSAVREALVEDAFDPYRLAVQSLAEQHDALDVAAAALKIAAEAMHGEAGDHDANGSERSLAAAEPQREQHTGKGARGESRSESRGAQGARGEPRSESRGGKASRRPERTSSFDGSKPPRRRDNNAMTRLVITVGDSRGVRPKDLVGAIANEAGISSESIGSIEIGETSSLVEVAEREADKVIRALARTTIKGQRVTARRESER